MDAVAEGAAAAGGLTVGLLPGPDAQASPPSRHLQVVLFTGLGQARNVPLVLSAHAVLALAGGWGTLSEIAHALKHRIPVVSLGSWTPVPPGATPDPLLVIAHTPEEAVKEVLKLARQGK